MTALGTTIARMRLQARTHRFGTPRTAHLSVSRWVGVPLLWIFSLLLGGLRP